MSQKDKNDIGITFTPEDIARGYGKFPYVIVRMHHAIYMQMQKIIAIAHDHFIQ